MMNEWQAGKRCMECSTALKPLASHKLLVTEGQQQRQQTAWAGLLPVAADSCAL